MRYAAAFLVFIAVCAALTAVLVSHSVMRDGTETSMGELKRIVRVLSLTDLFISTDARYTRNVSQADIFSAFQDFPGSLEHFPSGSVVGPSFVNTEGTELRVKRR